MANKLKVTLVKSPIGNVPKVRHVAHLVKVEEA